MWCGLVEMSRPEPVHQTGFYVLAMLSLDGAILCLRLVFRNTSVGAMALQ